MQLTRLHTTLPRLQVPFLSRTLLGLAIEEDAVVGTELVCQGQKITSVRTHRKAIENHDVAAALRKLTAHLAPARAYIACHLGPQHVRYQLAEGPVFEEWSSFEAWLEAEASHLLPLGAQLEDFETRYRIIEATEVGTWCLIALVHREAARARYALLTEAGLPPVLLGCLDAEVTALLAAEQAAPHVVSLFAQPHHAALAVSQHGLTKKLIPLAYGTGQPEALGKEVQTYLLSLDATPTSAPFVVVGDQADRVVQRLNQQEGMTFSARVGTLSLRLRRDSFSVEAEDFSASALALGLLHGTDHTLNFLGPQDARAQQQHIERAEAVRTLALVGGLLFVCLLFTLFTGNFVASKKAVADAELLSVSGQLAEIEEAQASLTQWKREVAQAERLVVERTHAATVLTVVGRVAPELVWLSGITVENDPNASGTHHLTLQGAALDEPSMAAYLDRLEQTSFIRNVRLLYSERIAADRLIKHATVAKRPVIRFEIQFDALPVDAAQLATAEDSVTTVSPNPVP